MDDPIVAGQSAVEPPRVADPFFSLDGPQHWNAYVGRQGDERYYVDGFLEAAIELATAVVEKGLSMQRDTLVMPILFTARHGLELSLKHAIRELAAGGILREPPAEDHDIAAHWQVLVNVPQCDAHLPRLVASLEPFMRSLADVDEDGQALRYHVRRDGTRSLNQLGLVNIQVVLDSLKALQEILKDLAYRVVELVEERRSGTCTSACSRSDLFMIAHRLPPRAEWGSPDFLQTKAAIREQFGLSGRQVSDALDVIQGHRQLGAMIGLEFDLAHLDDDDAIFAIELWRSLHARPPEAREDKAKGGLLARVRKVDFAELQRTQAALDAAAPKLLERLSADALADLETLYQMGRGTTWPESYAFQLERIKAEHAASASPRDQATYLLGKGNLGDAVSDSLARLGRPRLAAELKAI